MSWIDTPLSPSFAARVEKFLRMNGPSQRIVGLSSSSPFSMLFHPAVGKDLHIYPHVIITPDMDSALDMQAALRFFSPASQVNVLPPFDVDIYSNIHPNQRIIAQRLSWLYHAHESRGGEIFLAPIPGLLQKTLPYQTFIKKLWSLKKDGTLPSDFPTYLHSLGYQPVPTVEDVGTFCSRGGILDVFSPAYTRPIRIELFGDIIESIRFFELSTQLSAEQVDSVHIIPTKEAIFSDDNRQMVATALSSDAQGREVDAAELSEILRSVSLGQYFYGSDFLLPYFYKQLSSPIEFFSSPVTLWYYDSAECTRASDQLWADLKNGFSQAKQLTLRADYKKLFNTLSDLNYPTDSRFVHVDHVQMQDTATETSDLCDFHTYNLRDFATHLQSIKEDPQKLASALVDRIRSWQHQGHSVFVTAHNQSLAQRIQLIFERTDYRSEIIEDATSWKQLIENQKSHPDRIPIIIDELPHGFRFPDDLLVLIPAEDILGKRKPKREEDHQSFSLERAEALSFGELQSGDYVVHKLHGVGVYVGLKAMTINDAESEFIEIRYKDNDRLYLPVYRIGQLHKYSGPNSTYLVDKLGGLSWQKTQTKVRSQLRDVAAQLLKLYAARSQMKREHFQPIDSEYEKFENSFPYQETDDQMKAIQSVINDMTSDRPMDRLICGDVGFGKTEVALRAAFKCAGDHRQVALIAPTTILTYQHYENFRKRFAQWPFTIRALNRFIPNNEIKKTIAELKEGKVDFVIGTHRLLSKDVQFKNLGLLIIDEEQKFGVLHKERLRQLRQNVDTLTLSATPIPRTLNLSLVGVRDLSLINTPPEDRLPTRTYICKFDPETIKKAIESEIARGGQIFFLHNRVQSIAEVAAEIREIVPQARLAVAHGQMDEEQLENTMLKFFNHELDILVCTAIIESGMDIPRANTIFIHNAHTFGVSQLYQLRGRVGRSKERAYCYLLLPNEKRVDKQALERLKVIQENTALGSGLRVAQYDLELRGAGDILGEDQSGHINAVGYELYTELLEEAVHELKGDGKPFSEIEPEINLRVPALLPDKYIPDIRLRLYYYKTLSTIRNIEDIEKIEDELRDQFGAPPEPVMNLLGLMVIRKLCRDLGVRDISAGKNIITLAFSDQTRLPPQEVVRLTTRENKKFQLTPDQRLKIRMNEIAWPKVIDELEYLIKLIPKTLH